jgi:hypothetical protein
LRQLDVVPLGRIQSARSVASPFQRRRGLATAQVDLAGSARATAVVDQLDTVVADLTASLPRGQGWGEGHSRADLARSRTGVHNHRL